MHIDVLQKLKRNSGQFEGGGSSKWIMFRLCLGRGRPCLLFIQQLFTISSLFFSNGGYICSRNWNTEFTWIRSMLKIDVVLFPKTKYPKIPNFKIPKQNTQKIHREILKKNIAKCFSEYPKNTQKIHREIPKKNIAKYPNVRAFQNTQKILKKTSRNTQKNIAKYPKKTSQNTHFFEAFQNTPKLQGSELYNSRKLHFSAETTTKKWGHFLVLWNPLYFLTDGRVRVWHQ